MAGQRAMWQWAKKLFREEREKKPETTMVEVLRELWDIDDSKHHEVPPPNVVTDIYHVEPRNKAVPRRDPRRRQRYKRQK